MNGAATLRSRARGIFLLILMGCVGFGTQVTASAQPSTEARLREVVEKFFDAYHKKDLERLMSMWSEGSPDRVAARQKLGQIFAGAGRIELVGLTFKNVLLDDKRASARVAVEVNATDAKTGKPAFGFGRINRAFDFVWENEEWRVWRYRPPEEDLAAALVKAKSDAEREALLDKEKDLATVDLVLALVAEARRLAGQGSFKDAVWINELALRVAGQVGDKTATAKALFSFGFTYASQGEYAEALARYQKSLSLARELDDKSLIASCYNNIGIVYDSQGNYRRALEYYQNSLRLKEQLGDKAGISRLLNNLGIVHRLQGNSDLALDYLQRSLRIKEELGDDVDTASALSNIGEVLTGKGNYAQALDYLERSLKLSEAGKDQIGEAQTLGNLGLLFQLQGNYAGALDYLQKNLAINEGLGDKAQIAATFYNLGEIHLFAGRYSQAGEMAEKAASLAKQIDLAEVVWLANALAGRVYQAIKQPDKARRYFLAAIETVEKLRDEVGGGEQEQQRSFENRLSPYHGMVDLSVEQHNAAEALFYAERAKSRVLLDVLQSGRMNITKAMTSEEQEKEHAMRSEAVSLNVQLYGETQQASGDAVRRSGLEARLQKARLDYEAFQTGLYVAHPELKVQRGRMQPIAIDQIGGLMPDAGTALLEFVVLKDKTFLFVLTGKKGAEVAGVDLAVYTLPVKQKELADLTQRFGQYLGERRLNVSELAGRLYDVLLKPAREQLRDLNALIIVPDDVLWQLPFQALQPSNGRYLIEDCAISYAQSLTVLREIRQQLKQASPNKGSPTLLAFGDSGPRGQTAGAKTQLMDARLQPLPEAERQVRMLGQLYGQDQSRIYTRLNAREEQFKAEAGNYRVLHLATHGILNDASPMYSQLVLSPSQANSLEDGLLEAWEIMKLNLKADLVVLSACETARGRVGAGEGIIGLSWALFVAGAPTAVVSQWKVESSSSTELILEFHRLIKENARLTGQLYGAAALRQAALKLIKNKKYDHPFYWAPFVIIGNGMGMPPSKSP